MCDYCGCRSIPLIGQLSAQHEDIINASTALRRAGAAADTAAVIEAVDELRRLLHPHTSLEERGLLTELRQDDEFTEDVDALCGEHTALEAGLDGILAGDLDGVPALLHLLREHINKEENGLFPAAAIHLSDDQWERLDADEPMTEASRP